MAPDYDDVGAMAVLHALADSGEVDILATVSSNKQETTAPCIDVLNTYFGRPGIPVGAPKGEELDHDYLWRIKRELPNNGWISIFDRSHYEDIVMPRIYKTQPEEMWQARYDEINRFESQLTADGCAIIKIFLVVSKDEQKRHFLSRLDDPTKYWKFDPSDLEARARWDDYMAAWQDVFLRTSTEQAPWYLVPADNRWYSRAVVSELLRNTLKNMNMIWPPLEVDADEMRRQLDTL